MTSQEVRRELRAAKPKLNYRHAPIPINMLNDARLEAIHVVAWGVMWDASREQLSTISERRLGMRLRRSEDAARRIIRKLAETGWIKIIDHGNGHCRQYELTTPSTDATGTPGMDATGTPSTDAADPLHSRHQTPGTDAAQPRVSLDNYLGDRKRKDDGVDAEERKQSVRRLSTICTGIVEGKRIPEAVA